MLMTLAPYLLWPQLINAVVALHNVEGSAALELHTDVSTERNLIFQGRGDFELVVPELHGFPINIGLAGQPWYRRGQVDA